MGVELTTALEAKRRKTPDAGIIARSTLIYPPDFTNPGAIEVMGEVTRNIITQHSGLQPTVLTSSEAHSKWDSSQVRPCVVARFEVNTLSAEQMHALSATTKEAYAGTRIKDVTSERGKQTPPSYYPLLERDGVRRGQVDTQKSYLGWYLGPDTSRDDGMEMGMYMHRYVGSLSLSERSRKGAPDAWFCRPELVYDDGQPVKTPKGTPTYQIELRLGDNLSQTQMVEYITQVSAILGGQGRIEDPKFPFAIYAGLLERGLREVNMAGVKGLEEQMAEAERVLFGPIVHPELSETLGLIPKPVLLIGVPGTGKTLLANMLTHKFSRDMFIVPLDPRVLAQEMTLPLEKQTILPRLAAVHQRTGVPVILQMDDIEILADAGNSLRSGLQNLLDGIGARGFLLLASSNEPRRFMLDANSPNPSPSLLQPGRLGHVIHVGLPNAEARHDILDFHMPPEVVTAGEGADAFRLFEEGEREAILDILSLDEFTGEGFTSRFLAEICSLAKARFVQRVAQATGITSGITPRDIEGLTFTIDDWTQARRDVLTKFGWQMDILVKQDEEMARLASSIEDATVGFTSPTTPSLPGDEALRARIHARRIEAALRRDVN